MKPLRMDDIQNLLQQFKDQGMVVSCYADNSVVDGLRSDALGDFRNEARALEERFAHVAQTRREFERNVDAIRAALTGDESRGARGVAVFSTANGEKTRVFPFDQRIDRHLWVGREPRVTPLVEMLYRQREYLVVLTDSHRARLYAASPGGLRLLQELDDHMGRRQRASDRGSVERDTELQRHREEWIGRHLKEVAQAVQAAAGSAPYQGIILLGQHEFLSEVRDQLPHRLSDRVVGEDACAWPDGDTPVNERVQRTIGRASGEQEGRVLDEMKNRLEQGYAVAGGPQAVIDAVLNDQVNYLVMGPDRDAPGARCTGCGYLFAGRPETCQFCNEKCEPKSLWQEILLLALKHDILVYFVRNDAPLSAQDGIAATLTREDRTGARTTGCCGRRPGLGS